MGLTLNTPRSRTSKSQSKSNKTRSNKTKSRGGQLQGAQSKGKNRADPELTEEEEEDDDDDDDDEDEQDEDEEDEEDEGVTNDPWDLSASDAQLNVRGMQPGAETEEEGDDDDDDDDNEPPTPEDIGLNAAVVSELAKLSERARRRRLWELSTLSDYDLLAFNTRTQNKLLMQKINEQYGIPSAAPATKKSRERAAPADSGPRRQSARLHPPTLNSNGSATTSNNGSSPDPPLDNDGILPASNSITPANTANRTALTNTANSIMPADATRTAPTSDAANSIMPADATRTAPTSDAANSIMPADATRTAPTSDAANSTAPASDAANRTAPTSDAANRTAPASDAANSTTPNVSANSTVPADAAQIPALAPNTANRTAPAATGNSTTPAVAAPQAQEPHHGSLSLRNNVNNLAHPAATQDGASRAGWPTWVQEAYDALARQDLGATFESAVNTWTMLERVYGWEMAVSEPVIS